MKRARQTKIITVLTAGALAGVCACSTVRSVLAPNSGTPETNKPIKDPFGDYQANASIEDPSESMIFRAKRNDGALELEIPKSTQGVTDFVLPMPDSKGRIPASVPDDSPHVDNSYKDRAPTRADREITSEFARQPAEDSQKQAQIEQGLGVVEADDPAPQRDKSYLAAVDHVKQLYRAQRYEAALLELDPMIRDYPTDPKLHEMRGTLLDRLGHGDLAMKSWNQALRLDPKNESLRHFIERRQQRSTAGVPQ